MVGDVAPFPTVVSHGFSGGASCTAWLADPDAPQERRVDLGHAPLAIRLAPRK
jgi:hypothetical protein